MNKVVYWTADSASYHGTLLGFQTLITGSGLNISSKVVAIIQLGSGSLITKPIEDITIR